SLSCATSVTSRPRSPSRHLPPHLLLPPRTPRTTPFPYTTLFRSLRPRNVDRGLASGERERGGGGRQERRQRGSTTPHRMPVCSRSEEHTSELQSHLNLVCRLLLEKKKN